MNLVFLTGETDTEGSEHSIDGTKYPLEVHIVYFDCKFDNPETAFNATTKTQSNFAVLAVIFEVLRLFLL